jgi:XTP/dITP diphosphohydrolase
MKLLFATTNPHKAEEVRELLLPTGVQIQTLDEVSPDMPAPEENADTLEGNARLKATAYAQALGLRCLADDSGLEVDALGGAPGVHSARYAGKNGTREQRDRANRHKLVAELAALGDVDRSARLVCALCLADETGQVLFESRGVAEAQVIDQGRGDHGFGYDSLLLIADLGRTLAEISPSEWNARSHRGAAVRALAAWLASNRVS